MARHTPNPDFSLRGPFRLAFALALSLLVHVGVLAIVSGILDTDRGAARAQALKPPSTTIRLGISESTIETLTWLGFAMPTPHEAIQSEVEQAAFALASLSGQPAVNSQSPGATPMGVIEQSESSASLSDQARSPPMVPDAQPLAPAFEAELGPIELPTSVSSLAVTLPEGLPDASEQTRPANGQGTPGRQSTKPGEASETRRDGTPSEKESPATSPSKPLRVQPGKPAAAQGLEIQTRVPPELTIPTRLLAGNRRAVYKVSFASDGTVKTAKTTNSSGNAELDEAGLNAMYSWTAKGKALEDLDGDDVISVYIELIPPR